MVTENTHYWEKYGFFGGHVFLDFINTVDDVEKTRALEGIENWDVLLRWAQASRLVSESEVLELANNFSSATTKSELDNLHQLRELAWTVLSAVANNRAPDTTALSALRDEIRWAYTQSSLIHSDQEFRWEATSQLPAPSLIRVRLGLAADNLLSSKPLRITECGACTGLFLNKGRGVGRKWCRMQSCGNRAKVNKFRTR